MKRKQIGLAALVLLISVSGCGPGPNDPPTDSEILQAYLVHWNADGVRESDNGKDKYHLLTPTNAHKNDNDVITDSPFGKVYRVSVSISFQANADLSYQCTELGFYAQPIGGTQYANVVHAGDTISCEFGESYLKVNEGWLVSYGWSRTKDDYVIKR